EVTIRVNNEEFTIREGESIKFKADREHAYHNSGELVTRLSMVIYYPA
ncbi:MAG: DNA-binding protein, partial [Brevibacillus sp.]|nr:DNA-binding protein [Brevibacillus sp.]